MCDSCGIESQPLRVFSPVKVVSRTLSQGPASKYCLPCFRSALRLYKAAGNAGPGPRPPETSEQVNFTGKYLVLEQSVTVSN